MNIEDLYQFFGDNSIEMYPNDTFWKDKDGIKFKPKYTIVINGVNMAPLSLEDAINKYKELH